MAVPSRHGPKRTTRISDYIENYYNAKRRHSAAANRSPIAFELVNAAQLAA